MIIEHFYERLLLVFIFGLMLFWAFKHMAVHNPINEYKSSKTHRWFFTIPGILFTLICIASVVKFVYYYTMLEFPVISFEPIVPLDGIIRDSSTTIIWGYPTFVQAAVIGAIQDLFSWAALAVYFFTFKPSPSKWWCKILKIIGYIVVIMLYLDATDFHYFDYPEWITTILYLFALWICFAPTNKKKKSEEQQTIINTPQ